MEYIKNQAPEVCAYLKVKARKTIRLWFAMRVTYRREAEVKRILDTLGITSYTPMQWHVTENGKRVLEPAVRNLVFVNCTQDRMTEVKNSGRIPFMQYMMDGRTGNKIIVPDDDMARFISVTASCEENLRYYPAGEVNLSKGQKVRITGGIFQGCEGMFVKLKGMRSRKVVIEVKGVMSVALVSVSPEFIEII